MPTPRELRQQRDAERARNSVALQQQVRDAEVNTGTTEVNSGGIAGFVGHKENAPVYTAGAVKDTTTDANKEALQQRIYTIQQRQPTPGVTAANATGATIATGPQDQFRQQQMTLANTLAAQANGQGPSMADLQLKRATNRGMAQALALNASARGVNPALAAKNAMHAQAQIQGAAAADSAAMRLQEQDMARARLADVIATGRGADIGLATNQAGFDQQTALANAGFQQSASQDNAQLALQSRMSDDQAIQQLMAAGMTLDEARMQRTIQQRQFNTSTLANQEAAHRGVSAQNDASAAQAGGAAISAFATMMAASDERLKTDIKPGADKLDAFLDELGAHDYEYNDEGKANAFGGEGRYVSPMAQELERTDLGRALVLQDKRGRKIVDYGKGFGTFLAIVAKQNREIKALQRRAA